MSPDPAATAKPGVESAKPRGIGASQLPPLATTASAGAPTLKGGEAGPALAGTITGGIARTPRDRATGSTLKKIMNAPTASAGTRMAPVTNRSPGDSMGVYAG